MIDLRKPFEFMSKFQSNRSLSLGLDEGTHALRYVLVNTWTKEVVDWGSFELTTGQTGKGKQSSVNSYKEIAKKIPVNSLKSIQLNLQGASVQIGNVQIPKGDKNSRENTVRLALRSQLPFPVGNAAYFYREYDKESDQAADGKIKISYVAAEKKFLSSTINTIADIFRIVPQVTVQGFAFENLIKSLGVAGSDETIAVLNVGRSMTAISIFHNKEMLFERDIPLAGQDFTRSIMMMYRPKDIKDQMLDLNHAELIKHQSSIPLSSEPPHEAGEQEDVDNDALQNKEIFGAIQGVLSAWVQDIRLSFNYYYENCHSHKISRIFVLGGSAHYANLCEYLGKELEINVKPLVFKEDGDIKIVPSKDGKDFGEHFNVYCTALAFAFKHDKVGNLTPTGLQRTDYTHVAAPVLRIAYIFIAAIVLTWMLFVFVQGQYLNDLKSVLSIHGQFLKKIEVPYYEIMEWKSFFQSVDSKSYKSSSVLKVLSRINQKNILFRDVTLDRENGGIVIEGTVFGDAKYRAVRMAEFARELKQTGVFLNVEMPSSGTSRFGTDGSSFRIVAKIIKPGASA